MIAKRKPKKCKVCLAAFMPAFSLARVCSVQCALLAARAETVKRNHRELRQRKTALKSRSQWMREVQTAFNAYIRARDTDLPCISCGNFTPETRGGDYDCGHYRSVGANPELRFCEDNAHKQCKRCNSHLSGNIVNYRIGLLMRIGAEKVEWLEGPHEPKKYTIDDLKALKAEYRQKLKDLKANPVYPVI